MLLVADLCLPAGERFGGEVRTAFHFVDACVAHGEQCREFFVAVGGLVEALLCSRGGVEGVVQSAFRLNAFFAKAFPSRGGCRVRLLRLLLRLCCSGSQLGDFKADAFCSFLPFNALCVKCFNRILHLTASLTQSSVLVLDVLSVFGLRRGAGGDFICDALFDGSGAVAAGLLLLVLGLVVVLLLGERLLLLGVLALVLLVLLGLLVLLLLVVVLGSVRTTLPVIMTDKRILDVRRTALLVLQLRIFPRVQYPWGKLCCAVCGTQQG